MSNPLIAVVGDISSDRKFEPPMRDPAKAKKAAEELGAELARQGARLLVYGGPFLETDVVRGFVAAKPKKDHSILMWFTTGNEPPAFQEEESNPRLFERRSERGADWEVAFYRSVAQADGIILMGGNNATKISGQVAIGTRMPILALSEFGGGAAKVWDTLSAGADLPTREEINVMARPWSDVSAEDCVKVLLAQSVRRNLSQGPKPELSVLAGVLFALSLSIVPWVWGKNNFAVWMLFIVPLVAGGAGAAIRAIVDRMRGLSPASPAVLATIVLGLVAGGVAGVLFVTAQLTADPNLVTDASVVQYAQRSIPFALGVGFIAGLTSDTVYSKLLGTDVVRTSGISKVA